MYQIEGFIEWDIVPKTNFCTNSRKVIVNIVDGLDTWFYTVPICVQALSHLNKSAPMVIPPKNGCVEN